MLVNNTGIIGPTAAVHEVGRDEWESVLAVNLTGAFQCARAVLPEMIGLTLTLGKKAGAYNVQVNSVCPGPVFRVCPAFFESRGTSFGREAVSIIGPRLTYNDSVVLEVAQVALEQMVM